MKSKFRLLSTALVLGAALAAPMASQAQAVDPVDPAAVRLISLADRISALFERAAVRFDTRSPLTAERLRASGARLSSVYVARACAIDPTVSPLCTPAPL